MVFAGGAATPFAPTPLLLLCLLLSLRATANAFALSGDEDGTDGALVPEEPLGDEGEDPQDPGIVFYAPAGVAVGGVGGGGAVEGGGALRWPWSGGGRMPCSCQTLTCGCCARMEVASFGFNRTGCMNFTYEPYEFAVVARLFFGESLMFERSFSGKNPPPVCLPVPVPYLPTVDVCVKFFDVYTPGRNLHLCMDWEARLQRAPVVVLHFDCVRVGRDGVQLLKPQDGDGLPSSTPAPAATPPAADPTLAPGATQDPDSVYDEVAPGRTTEGSAPTEEGAMAGGEDEDEDVPGGEVEEEPAHPQGSADGGSEGLGSTEPANSSANTETTNNTGTSELKRAHE